MQRLQTFQLLSRF